MAETLTQEKVLDAIAAKVYRLGPEFATRHQLALADLDQSLLHGWLQDP